MSALGVGPLGWHRLNEVRPGRPEQSVEVADVEFHGGHVSMKSGLEDRNNPLKLPTWSSTEDMSQ